MRNTLLFLGAIILIGGGYFFYSRSGGTSTPAYTETKESPGLGVTGAAADSTDPYDVTITYTDEGYTPSEISIKKGQRVRFLNQSSSETWPASAVHPTHTLYPEKESTNCLGSSFDACKGLKTGEFFDFTFNYAGEWRYHDHVHAYHTGVITVTQ